MIPKIIHYIWLGDNEKPELIQRCYASWHTFMPESDGWSYMEWNEQTIEDHCKKKNLKSPISNLQYCAEAYAAHKYAFVSDYVRLWALDKFGGLYMDVDFEVYKSFKDLLDNPAFAGWQGSKRLPIMMGVMASEAHGEWVKAMLKTYENRPFIMANGSFDMTPNTEYFTDWMVAQGFVCDGVEKDWNNVLHVYPVDYFCPGLTTGENIRSKKTYCEHKGLHSWSGSGGWKAKVLNIVGPAWKAKLIKLKRKIVG